MAVYSRELINCSIDTRMPATIVCNARSRVLLHHRFPVQIFVHRDRGDHYCSKNSRDLITSYNLKQSTNSKGDCWESAYVEISFHSIKVEAI
ncbi:transposase family protein [Vibrio parahaemolyticus]|nr:transposase family protein [Vibrio parahaemolyticus]OQS92166.1 hypothetical protein EN04_023980 [Vibrio parahaemolyticus O4:K12 str. K1203]EGQ7717509.1 transposase family protein [Vibrio parahaemolyticus]EGQ7722065.1 transposase family protein [Vibrio parahaemolyticus]EGQ7726943.1 transposase family protein [Vibrio parahaemolyticus]